MQTQPHTQATFTMPAKPHRLIASDRVERTMVRRSDGTKVGTIERLMIDKVSGKVAYAVYRRPASPEPMFSCIAPPEPMLISACVSARLRSIYGFR